MKEISLKMNENFKIEVLFYNKIYELENNSTLLSIECDVGPEMVYKLHIESATDKTLTILDKGEGMVYKNIVSPYFSKAGTYYLQVEGVKEGYRIVSNTIKVKVGSFINAECVPTPEEESVIDEMLMQITALENDARILSEKINEINADKTNEITDENKDSETKFPTIKAIVSYIQKLFVFKVDADGILYL